MPPLVVVTKLTRLFGHQHAVRGLDLRIEEGSVLGLIGPNGAGKSTTLKMLATILKPTAGDATIAGFSLTRQPMLVRRIVGYMPDVSGLYEEMLVHEYLRFFASIYGIRGEPASKAIDDVLKITGLESKINDTCGALSRGMAQLLHLARVMLHDPKLLLLDEPAAGLDPRARIEFRELVLALKRMGKTLVISSHILSELGEMCDAIAIIEKAELVYSGPVDQATAQVRSEGRVVRVVCREEPALGRSRGDLVEVLKSLAWVDAVREGEKPGEVFVRLKPELLDLSELNRELVQRGFKIERFAEEEVRLEEAFMHLTRGVVS